MSGFVAMHAASARPRLVVCAAANQRLAMPKETPASSSVEEEIYVGKGRFIKDDPRKYPSRDFTGVGGWSGGEAGLWQFRDELKREGYGAKMPRMQTASGTQIIRADKLDGKDLVYVGKGEYVRDDVRKYASKEDAGFLAGATGGFAGGEQGVQMFIEKGNLSLAESTTVKQRQMTKDLITLGSLVAFGGIAALWLREQGLVAFDLPQVSLDLSAATPSDTAGAVSSAASSVAASIPALQVNSDVVAVLLAGSGVLAATFAVRQGIEKISTTMVSGLKRSVVQGLYAAAVAVAAYALVMDQ